MSHINVNIRLRPIRFAFLVRPDDNKQVQEIFRVNTCLWGGKYNPIIPCFKQVPKWWDRNGYRFETASQIINGYLDLFEPDFLVEAEEGLSEGLGFDKKRVLQLDQLLTRADDRDRRGFGLNVLDLYRDSYQKEFQFTRRHEHDIVDIAPEKSIFSKFNACVFGAFPDEADLNYLAKAFTDAFEPKKVTLNGSSLAVLYRSGFTSALRIGHSKIEVDYHDHSNPTLFVLDANKSRDLIDFWNLRAVRRHVIPIPVQWIEELSEFCKEFITQNHRPLPGNPNGVMIHVTVMFGRSIPTADIERLHAEYFRVDIVGANVIQIWYPTIWRPTPEFTVREMRPTLSAITKTFDLSVSTEKPEIRFDCLNPDFAEEYGNEYRWANVVTLRDWTLKNQIATTFLCDYRNPTIPKLGLGGEHLLPTTEGLVIFPQYKNLSQLWRLTDGATAINSWLKSNGINAVFSDAGRATQQIIQTLGGFWGVKSLAHPDIVKLLNEISRKPGSRSIQQQEFSNRIQNAIKNNIWREGNFETLVKRNAVELGLELRCTKCSSWSWYSLKQLDYQLTCGLCLREFAFPVIEPTGAHNSKWAYRLIGPFALPNYANGGYAASLSIRFFAEIIGRTDHADVTWSAGQELELAPNDKVESDFILWYQRKKHFGNDHPTDLVFGEAKSFRGKNSREKRTIADAFQADDVERMKKLAICFPGSILVFSTMKQADELSTDEVARIAKLAEWGREYIKDKQCTRAAVILLTGTELFTAYSLEEEWKQKGGKLAQLIEPGWIRPENLRVLANLTQQAYLGMPSYENWREEKWKRRLERRKD